MNLEIKEKLIRATIAEAQNAINSGNSPFGAVLSDKDGNIINSAHNTSTTDCNPTAHIEINLIRKISKKIKSKNLSNYYLATNAESCPMCFSASIKAKITNFIYGAKRESDSNPNLGISEILKFSKGDFNIYSGILEEECTNQIKNARENQSK